MKERNHGQEDLSLDLLSITEKIISWSYNLKIQSYRFISLYKLLSPTAFEKPKQKENSLDITLISHHLQIKS